MGRAPASALLPILRSDALARVLTETLLANEPLQVRELADRTALPYSTVQREVDRLEQTGAVRSERRGSSRFVGMDGRYPYLDELRALLVKAYGPAMILADSLCHLDGVEQGFIFGSWARRYEGDWGPAPRDIDVLLVGSPSVDEVDVAASKAEARLGQRVQTTIVSVDEWRAAESVFVRTVKSGPVVDLARD